MTVEVFTSLITNLGFPIALVLAMGWFIYKIWQQSVEREKKLYEEIAECRTINSKAIDTISSYAEKLESIQNDVTTIKMEVESLTHG